MKTIITLFTALTISSAFAITSWPSIPTSVDIQSESDWAIAMTKSACSDLQITEGLNGEILDLDNGDVQFNVYNVKGNVVASATSKSTSIFSKKSCL